MASFEPLTALICRFPFALKVFIKMSAATFGPGMCARLIYYTVACPAYCGGNDIPSVRCLRESPAPKCGCLIG